jgi:uncharacterized membrane protein YhaH (DUF805 family)
MISYYILNEESAQGPYTLAELLDRYDTRQISSETFVCEHGKAWVRVSDLLASIARQGTSNALNVNHKGVAPPVSAGGVTKAADVASHEVDDWEYDGFGRLNFGFLTIGIAVFGGIVSALTRSDWFGVLVALGLMFLPTIERLKNIGRSRAWSLLLLVPLIGTCLTALCLVLPPGFENHKTLDAPAKVMIVLAAVAAYLTLTLVLLR